MNDFYISRNIQTKLTNYVKKLFEMEKRLFAISLICGICDKPSVSSIAYTLFVIVLLASILVWELAAKVVILYPTSVGTVTALDVIARVTSLMSLVVCITCSAFSNRARQYLFLRKMEEINISLRARLRYSPVAVEFLCIYTFFHAYIVIEILYEYTLILAMFGHFAAIINALKIIYMYVLALQVMDIVFWSISIKKKAIALNLKLADVVSYWKTRKSIAVINDVETIVRPSLEIHFFMVNYNKLCDIVELFQRIYGYQILVIMLSVIAVTVKTIHTGLMLALDARLNHWLSYTWIVFGANACNAGFYIVSRKHCIIIIIRYGFI